MSIKITIDSDALPKEPEGIKIALEARKTLDGKIMILDHIMIDIILDTQEKKIVAFPKKELTDEIYGIQNSYFKYLQNEGVIIPESVIAGSVYGSMEGYYPDSADEGVSAAQVVLLTTKNFIDQENPKLEAQQFIEFEIDDHMVEPEPEDSTELGEVPQAPEKGSITPERVRRYLSGYGYY